MKRNDIVVFLLQSPLHIFMGGLLLITVRGRRTGRTIALPVNYYREGDELWILSTRIRTWWRNVIGGAEVGLRIDGRDCRGFAETIQDPKVVATNVCEYVRRLPLSARPLGVRVQDGVASSDDTRRVALERLFVRVRIIDAKV